MFTRWRSEIEKGRADAQALGDRMQLLVWQMIKVALIGGLVIGALIGGLTVWLMK